jgi:hypothetical protein
MLLAVLAALAVIALRLILFAMGRPPEGTDFMLVHFLAIVTIVFFTGHRALGRDVRVPFPTLVREGFKGAALYAILFGAFIWCYYRVAEPDHFAARVDAMVEHGVAEGQPEGVIRPKLTQFFTPFNYASITFFALLAVSAFNALLVGAVHHKLLRRYRLNG